MDWLNHHQPGTDDSNLCNATSFITAIEQPLPWLHGLTLTAEWFSGSQDLSNLIVGAAYHPSPRVILVLGDKIPTKDRIFTVSEQALVFEITPTSQRIRPINDDRALYRGLLYSDGIPEQSE